MINEHDASVPEPAGPSMPPGLSFFAGPEHEPFSFGREEDPAVLLLHGFAGTPAEVLPLGRRLAQANFRTRGILLPGFGSEIPYLGEKTRDHWFDAGRQAWRAMGSHGRPRILVGYSMGAALALRLAAEDPPERLVLLAPFWRFPLTLAQWLLPLFTRIKPRLSPFDFGPGLDDPNLRAQLLRMAPDLNLQDPETVSWLQQNLHLPTAVLEEVRQAGLEAYQLTQRITCPTLVIQGTDDTVVRVDHTRQLVRRLRKSAPVSLFELPHGHEFPKTSAAYHGLVLDFLKSDSLRSIHVDNHLVAATRSSPA